jgi:hypothetical protein
MQYNGSKYSHSARFQTILVYMALQENSLNENLELMILLINVHRKRDFEHLLTLTDSFKQKDLRTRDPDTGHLTKAGYIPVIRSPTM